MKTIIKTNFDFLGMILSIGCVIHCLLLPIILPALPMLGFAFDHESNFHLILSTIITLIAVAALIPGYRKHGYLKPIFLAIAGINIIVNIGFLEKYGESPIIIFSTVFGSTLIIIGHYLNHKYLCACKHPRHQHDHKKENSCH